MSKDRVCFISIDIEHDHGSENAKTFSGAKNMKETFDILERDGISATLFVTGEILEKYPDLVREWAKNHEIACHSYSHTFFDLVPEPYIREELESFINLYKKILNAVPLGFRAPSHVVDNAAIRAISDAGFYYDSSVVPHYPPFKKYRGYLGSAPKSPYCPDKISYKKEGNMKILELPVAGHLFGIPLAGAWLRRLPLSLYQFLFVLHKPNYISFSFHSWDALCDPKFLEKVKKMIGFMKTYGYQFKRGDKIFHEYISKN